MYCPICHSENDENTANCVKCGSPLTLQPKTNLSRKYSSTTPIVATVLSFFGFNVLGIIFSVLSLKYYNAAQTAFFDGDGELYEKLGAKSRKFAKASLIITILLMVIRPIFFVVCFVIGADTAAVFGESGIFSDMAQEATKAAEAAVRIAL